MKRCLAWFLCVFTALVLSPAAFSAPARERDYAEESAYWKKVHLQLNERSDYPSLWTDNPPEAEHLRGPMVVHLAILESALSKESIKSGLYNKARFPLYCGYLVIDPYLGFTFVKKTDLPIVGVMAYLEAREREQTRRGKSFAFYFDSLIAEKIIPIQHFPGLYGMDFIPRFKHGYPLGQRPKGLGGNELIELKNRWTPLPDNDVPNLGIRKITNEDWEIVDKPWASPFVPLYNF